MTSGTILRSYKFVAGTYVVDVKNYDGTIIRYGEIKMDQELHVSQHIGQGEKIGKVMLNEKGNAMLHIETYAGNAKGLFKISGKNDGYLYSESKNYERRNDLIDPMGILALPYY